MTLYRINPSVVEPEWTERGLAKLLSDEAIVPVTIDYEAAEAFAHKFIVNQQGQVGWGATIKEIVDAALGGNNATTTG